jgi:N-methylhydantoinase A
VQGVTYRLEAVVPTDKVEYPRLPRRAAGAPERVRTISLHYLGEEPIPAAEYQRVDLMRGDMIEGPAVIREQSSTTFMLPGQMMTVGEFGELRITRRA